MRYAWVLITSSLLLQAASAAAEEGGIGNASAVKNRVEGTIRGQTRALSSGSAVYANESVRTGQDSIAELGFVDSTKLSVGPTSEVRLDKFVYDPNKGAGAVALKATRGSLRFVTGVQDHDSYSIKTPYATLGVRGTVLEIVVKPPVRTQKHRGRAERQLGSRRHG
jgi:hypothetical protein